MYSSWSQCFSAGTLNFVSLGSAISVDLKRSERQHEVHCERSVKLIGPQSVETGLHGYPFWG